MVAYVNQTRAGRYNLPMPNRSQRIPEDLSLNRLAEARARIGKIPFDLTVSNPTVCDLPYPSDLFAPLADPRSLVYEPDPRGPTVARNAVAAQYDRWDTAPDPDRIVLTASTSESYSFLFRLFCDPGDAVLVPSPSYPLFDHLAGLDCVEAVDYVLDPEATWRIEFSTLEDSPASVRAVVIVHPNNPTGSFIHPEDRERLVNLCRERDWALISDEVFLPYPLDGGPGSGSTFAAVEDCLCCTLGGLSKSVGLPQLKLAWIVLTGPDLLVDSVLDDLDFVADAYLSVSTPVALAASRLLAGATRIQDAIAHRCRTNLETLRRLVSQYPYLTVPPVGGGWSAILRVPAVIDEEELCLKLLAERGVALYPGVLFGFPGEGRLVISLLPPTDLFEEGMRLVVTVLSETLTPRFDSNRG